MLATIDVAKYVARVTVDKPANIAKAKKAIKKAFQTQLEGKGFAIVEVLSACPTNWGLAPNEALQWLRDNMIPYYPLGTFKDWEEE
jgi:2-oxoglutarate ferredoxin oxidoreductase subunit beta